MSEPFIAEVRIWALNFAPRGWAFCDGQLLPISQNTALFSLVGTIYGGDGRTTFALPNLQDRAPMHPGRGPGLTSRRLGQRTGTPTVSLDESQLAAHKHIAITHTAAGTTDNPAGQNIGFDGLDTVKLYTDTNTPTSMSSSALQNTGSSQAHNNFQPLLTLNYCIALVGTFPSRS